LESEALKFYRQYDTTLYENILNFRCYEAVNVLLTQYHAGDKIEKIQIGGACSTYGGRERCVQDFGGET
jgi:hypothetical protein